VPTQKYKNYLSLFGDAENEFLVGLLKITHSNPSVLAEPLRFNSTTTKDILSRGDTFFLSGFDWRYPQAESGETRSHILLPVVDLTILQALRTTHEPFNLLLEGVLNSTHDEVEFSFNLLERNKRYDASSQSLLIECSYRNVMSNPRPRLRYSPSKFPAMFGRRLEQ
jgi:hypothetical protein